MTRQAVIDDLSTDDMTKAYLVRQEAAALLKHDDALIATIEKVLSSDWTSYISLVGGSTALFVLITQLFEIINGKDRPLKEPSHYGITYWGRKKATNDNR